MNSRHRIIGALVGAALLLSACGGSSSGPAPSATTTAAAASPHAPVQAPAASSADDGGGTAESPVDGNPDVSSSVVFDGAGSTPPSATSAPGASVAPNGPPAAGASDACALATAGDVTAAFGGKSGAGTANAGKSTCTWNVVGASFGTDCVVMVVIPAFPDDKTSFDQNKAQGGEAPTVAGVGDDAYNPEQGNPSLQFRKGDSVAEVDLKCTSDPDDAKESAAVITLAKAVVAKL